jgi:hypothetical protein
MRAAYVRAGKGTPPPGATPLPDCAREPAAGNDSTDAVT